MARTTTLEERCCIVDYVQAGLNDGDIAAKMNRSIHTVRKWRRRFNSGGRAALASTMGRPLTGAMSTFAAPIRQTVLQWRNDHPGWGTKTIHSQLRQESAWAEGRLPSPATISAQSRGIDAPLSPPQRLARAAEAPGDGAPPALATRCPGQ